MYIPLTGKYFDKIDAEKEKKGHLQICPALKNVGY